MLDTDVFSFITKGDPRAEGFRSALEGKTPCLAFATVAELFKGAVKARWDDARVRRLEAAIREYLVVPYDFELTRICGRLIADRETSGRRMEEFDAWIAATALRHAIPLATNNVKHFEGIAGLEIVVPAT